MSSLVDPTQHLAWLGSRALGIVAMLLVSASVGFGFAMSGKLGTRPGAAARFKTLHEALALGGLAAIAGHGLLLLADPYLSPGPAGIALPFAMPGQPVWTGVGIIAGWLTAIVTLSFYVRRRIGTAVWRSLHRFTIVAFVLSIAHTLGSGTDAGSAWLIVLLALAVAPAVALGAVRAISRSGARQAPGATSRASAASRSAGPAPGPPARIPVRPG